jgi:hypothetical protein
MMMKAKQNSQRKKLSSALTEISIAWVNPNILAAKI